MSPDVIHGSKPATTHPSLTNPARPPTRGHSPGQSRPYSPDRTPQTAQNSPNRSKCPYAPLFRALPHRHHSRVGTQTSAVAYPSPKVPGRPLEAGPRRTAHFRERDPMMITASGPAAMFVLTAPSNMQCCSDRINPLVSRLWPSPSPSLATKARSRQLPRLREPCATRRRKDPIRTWSHRRSPRESDEALCPR